MSTRGRMPSRLVVVAGTYDGVLAGWDTARDDAVVAAPKGGGRKR